DGVLAGYFKGGPDPVRTPRARATMVGRLFRGLVDKTFATEEGRFVLRCREQGQAHHPVRYWFEPVAEGETAVCGRGTWGSSGNLPNDEVPLRKLNSTQGIR